MIDTMFFRKKKATREKPSAQLSDENKVEEMISPDLPITQSSDDKLNRQAFAESLAHVLLQSFFPTSFTIGLYGAWGSGKTSLLNMVIEQVTSENNDVIVLRFNPWLCSDPKQLITQFFKQLASAIKLKKSTADTVYELVDQYADIFDAASLIPGAGIPIVATGKMVTSRARNRINQRDNDLQGKKDAIIRKIVEEKLKIVVSIDDIDRLSEEEIIAVFQLVKALADFPNAVYLLAFDYDVVVRALGKVQQGGGREYLEKVIQVPFEIPAPSMNSIYDALFSKLNGILGDIPEERWDKAIWVELFQYGMKKYIKSIRDVIRYSNVFYLKYKFLEGETDPIDLLGLTCLQVFEPTVYTVLHNYRDQICGSYSSYTHEQQEAEKEKVKKAVSEILAAGVVANEEAAKRILGILFPKTNVASGHSFSFGRYYDHRKFLINCNIAAPECFDRYFSLSLEDNAIPTVTVRKLIYDATERELLTGIDQLYQDGKIVRLLEEIEAYANNEDHRSIPSDRAALLISCLCKKWSMFDVEEEGFFTVPFAWRLLFCFDPLLNAIDTMERFLYLQGVFEDKEVEPSTLSLILHDFEVQHGRFTDKESRADQSAISLDELFRLEHIFKTRCVEAIESGAALSRYGGLNFLWLLGQIDEELVKHIKNTLVTDDISLAKIISYCTSHGKAATKLIVKTRQINKQSLSEFVDIEEANRRTCIFVTTRDFLLLPEEIQLDSVAFLMVMKRDTENSLMEGSVAEDAVKKELQKIIITIQQTGTVETE